MFINNKFNLGDIVYLKTDIDQRARIITAIKVRINDLIIYELSYTDVTTNHYEVEISNEKNILITI
jgi:hypothetical protein